jgi:hypothetical protein
MPQGLSRLITIEEPLHLPGVQQHNPLLASSASAASKHIHSQLLFLISLLYSHHLLPPT